MRLRIGKVTQNGQLSLHLCRYGRHFITQTEIQGNIRSPPPVVLEVCSDDSLTKSSLGDRTRDRRTQGERSIGQKIRQRAEGKFSSAVGNCEDIVPQALDIHAEPNGMSSSRKGDVV